MNKIRGNVVSTNMSPDKLSQRICVEVDSTLAKEGMPADAKAVGERVSSLHDRVDNTNDILREVKERVHGVEVKVVTDKTLTVLHRAADSATVGNRFGVVENSVTELESTAVYLQQEVSNVSGNTANLHSEVSDLKYRIDTIIDKNLKESNKAADAYITGSRFSIAERNIHNLDLKQNMLSDRIDSLENAGGGGVTEVYAAEYDPVEEELISNFSEMVAAYKTGKIVTLTGTNPIGNIDTLLCTHYDTEETSGYEGECLMFSSCGAGYTRTVYVTSNGIVGDFTTGLIFLKKDVDNIKEDMGDIDAALDAIIAIQNSLIGGDGV